MLNGKSCDDFAVAVEKIVRVYETVDNRRPKNKESEQRGLQDATDERTKDCSRRPYIDSILTAWQEGRLDKYGKPSKTRASSASLLDDGLVPARLHQP